MGEFPRKICGSDSAEREAIKFHASQ